MTRSERGAGRTEAVRLVNDSRATITAYVVVYVPDEASYLDARYRLVLQRKPRH